MPDLATLLKVVHALVGVALLAGLIGRWTTLSYAARMTDVSALRQVLNVSARFERMVISSSIVVLLLGLGTAMAQGRPFLGPVQGAPIDWLFVSLLIYLSILPLVPLVFLPRGRVFDAALEEATAQNQVTDDLRAAFRDPVVYAAHVYELVAIVVVFVLMVAKPF